MDEKQVPEFTLSLKLDEINVVLNSLSGGPFNVVADLIGKIRSQAMQQLPAAQPVEKVEAEEV